MNRYREEIGRDGKSNVCRCLPILPAYALLFKAFDDALWTVEHQLAFIPRKFGGVCGESHNYPTEFVRSHVARLCHRQKCSLVRQLRPDAKTWRSCFWMQHLRQWTLRKVCSEYSYNGRNWREFGTDCKSNAHVLGGECNTLCCHSYWSRAGYICAAAVAWWEGGRAQSWRANKEGLNQFSCFGSPLMLSLVSLQHHF